MLSNMKSSAQRFANIYIRSTSDWAGSKKIKTDKSSVSFRPGILFKIITLVVFGGAFVLLIKEMIVNPGDKLGLMIFIAVLVGAILFLAIYQFFFSSKLNYGIQIDASRIVIGGETFRWNDIGATGILSKGAVKSRNHWLLIANKNGNDYKIFPLRLFVTFPADAFPAKLSKYVEYFKPVGR